MTSSSKDIRHIAPAEYRDSAQSIDERIKNNPIGIQGVVRTELEYMDRGFIRVISGMPSYLVSADRVLGSDAEKLRTARGAIIGGAVTGMLVVKDAYTPVPMSSRTIFDQLVIDIPDGTDKLDTEHQLAEDMRAFGHKGLEHMGVETVDLIEQWEMLAVEDVAQQPLFRVAAGFIAQAAYEKHEKAMSKEIAARIDADAIDWDAELRGLA